MSTPKQAIPTANAERNSHLSDLDQYIESMYAQKLRLRHAF